MDEFLEEMQQIEKVEQQRERKQLSRGGIISIMLVVAIMSSLFTGVVLVYGQKYIWKNSALLANVTQTSDSTLQATATPITTNGTTEIGSKT